MRETPCRIGVTRRQGNSPDTIVTYTRECTPDELANYAWKNQELQYRIISSIESEVRKVIRRAPTEPGPLAQTLIDAFYRGLELFDDLITPLVAEKYYEVTVMPAIRVLAEGFGYDPDAVDSDMRRNVVGPIDSLADVTDDKYAIQALELWHGEDALDVAQKSPFDVFHVLRAPEEIVFSVDEHEYWHQNYSNHDYPNDTDPITRERSVDLDIDPTDFDSALALYWYLRSRDGDVYEHNPASIADEEKWSKAEDIALYMLNKRKLSDSRDYAYAMGVYKQMGGKFKSSSRPKPKRTAKKTKANPSEYIFMDVDLYKLVIEAADDMAIDSVALDEFSGEYQEKGAQIDSELKTRRNRSIAKLKGYYEKHDKSWLDPITGSPTKETIMLGLWAYCPIESEELRAKLEARYGDVVGEVAD